MALPAALGGHGAALPEGVLERVAERLPGGGDDVRVGAPGRPGPPLGRRVDDHPRLGGRGGVAVEDADLVVHEVDAVELRVEGAQGLAQRRSSALTGPLPSAAVWSTSPSTSTLTVASARRSWPSRCSTRTVKSTSLKGAAVVATVPADEELEGGLGTLEARAFRLELLDELAQLARVDDPFQLMAELLRAPLGIDPPAELRDDEAGLVADESRVDVLVRVPDLGRRRPVHPALVGEGARADVGGVRVGRDVGDAGDVARELGEGGQIRGAGHRLEPHLEPQVRPDGHDVGVAAALAVAVHRALHVADAGPHGGQRVGHGQPRVVVDVDAIAYGVAEVQAWR